MSLPVPGTLWREQLASTAGKPIVVDSHVIPSGVQVSVSVYTLDHNSDYFLDPFTYDPDRWIPTKGYEAKSQSDQHGSLKHNPDFMSSSINGRSCAGSTMAYSEMSLATAKTLWYFDFECPSEHPQKGKTLEAGQNTEFSLPDVFTSSHNGPYLTFRLRGDYWKDIVATRQ